MTVCDSEPTGATIPVSAHGDDDDGATSGSAYVFRWIDWGIQFSEKLAAGDAAGGDNFGIAVSLSSAAGQLTALVGASLWEDGSPSNAGAAYVFDGVGGQSTETMAYDDDGNLTGDGEMLYEYDAENRLIEMRPASPQQGDIRTRFAYDFMGRRVRKLAHAWCEVIDPECELQQDGWETDPVEDVRFIYDGWNLVMERTCEPDCEEEVVRAKYAWGMDLAGLNGAGATGNVQSAVHGDGGISGLLAMEYHGFEGFAEQPKFLYFYDGNGNVGQVVTLDSGEPVQDPPDPMLYLPEGDIVSRYEYDPYGGTLLADDPLALNNPFRFSTKYYDAQPATAAAGERGLYYYGYRYYSPRMGRWLNRDPIGEASDANLYRFDYGNPANMYDPLGNAGHPIWDPMPVSPVFPIPPFYPEPLPNPPQPEDLDIPFLPYPNSSSGGGSPSSAPTTTGPTNSTTRPTGADDNCVKYCGPDIGDAVGNLLRMCVKSPS